MSLNHVQTASELPSIQAGTVRAQAMAGSDRARGCPPD